MSKTKDAILYYGEMMGNPTGIPMGWRPRPKVESVGYATYEEAKEEASHYAELGILVEIQQLNGRYLVMLQADSTFTM